MENREGICICLLYSYNFRYSLLMCNLGMCSIPNGPANGHVSYNSLFDGGIARYFCNNGFKLVGDEVANCNVSNVTTGENPVFWPSAPICQRKQ